MKFESKYLVTDQKTINVIGVLDETKQYADFVDNKGYVKISENEDEDSIVWIFAAEGKPLCSNKFPYFWFNEDHTKMSFSEPDGITLKAFSYNNAKPFHVNAVIASTEDNEKLFDDKEIADMNAAASFFIPVINENDDFLKKIVKSIIINKKTDISRLKSKTDEKYQLPNLKHALVGDTKMSITYFLTWMSLLGCTFDIAIEDDVDSLCKDTLPQPLIYRSVTNKIYADKNGDLSEIDSIQEDLPIENTEEITYEQN